MKPTDIIFQNNQAYLLTSVIPTVFDLESQIRRIQYDSFYEKYRNQRYNGNYMSNTKIPELVYPFYTHIFQTGSIPTPGEFISDYMQMFKNEFSVVSDRIIYGNNSFTQEALFGRLTRTYPSLIRDFHFYCLLLESGAFDKITYSCAVDLSGTDILITHNGKTYCIYLYVKTIEAVHCRDRKDSKKGLSPNMIHMPLNLSTSYKCGDINLYSYDDINCLKHIIL